MTADENFMRRCLELGRLALENGDAPIGCIIVLNNRIIAEAVESVKSKNDPSAHAELLAVRIACKNLKTRDLSGATLFSNVEPCVMCAYAIRQTGIGAVVFGIRNNRVGGANSKFRVLTDPEFTEKFPLPKIQTGVLLRGCETLWRQFEELRRLAGETDGN